MGRGVSSGTYVRTGRASGAVQSKHHWDKGSPSVLDRRSAVTRDAPREERMGPPQGLSRRRRPSRAHGGFRWRYGMGDGRAFMHLAPANERPPHPTAPMSMSMSVSVSMAAKAAKQLLAQQIDMSSVAAPPERIPLQQDGTSPPSRLARTGKTYACPENRSPQRVSARRGTGLDHLNRYRWPAQGKWRRLTVHAGAKATCPSSRGRGSVRTDGRIIHPCDDGRCPGPPRCGRAR